MEQQSRLKQRLVGAIVLVALGVIFIPMLLDGEREEGFIVNGSSIPAKPAEIENIRQLEFATDDSAEASDRPRDGHRTRESGIRIPVDERSAPLSAVVKEPAPANKEKTSKAKADKEPSAQTGSPLSPVAAKKKTLSVAPAIRAWAVQVGSFKQKSNALKLRNKLRKQNYKAFIEGLQSSDAQLIYRVRLGPYVSRASAEQVRDRLQARQKIKGLVVRHP